MYLSRGTLTFCSQTNPNIRLSPCRGGGGGGRIGETAGDESEKPDTQAIHVRFFFLFFSFFLWRI